MALFHSQSLCYVINKIKTLVAIAFRYIVEHFLALLDIRLKYFLLRFNKIQVNETIKLKRYSLSFRVQVAHDLL